MARIMLHAGVMLAASLLVPGCTTQAISPMPGPAAEMHPVAPGGPTSMQLSEKKNVPPAPVRDRVPGRKVASAQAENDSSATPPPAVPEAAMPPKGRSLPGPVQDALAGGLAEGSIVAADWTGHAARFELGAEKQAIRTLPILLGPAVIDPGPIELVGEPLVVMTGGVMSLAPGQNGKRIRALVEGETLFAFALTGDRNWMLVGQDGVALGYAPAPLLAPLDLAPSAPASRPLDAQASRQGAVLKSVPAATRCRALVIVTSGAVGTEEACLYPDGEWRLAPIR